MYIEINNIEKIPGELWKKYDDKHYLSNLGRWYSVNDKKIMKQFKNASGYNRIKYNNKNVITHIAVVKTFGDIQGNKFKSFNINNIVYSIDHIDRNKDNNSVINLEIIPHKENVKRYVKLKDISNDEKIFLSYINSNSINLDPFTKEFIQYLKKCYIKFQIPLINFINKESSEEEIFLLLNKEIFSMYHFKIHQIGFSNFKEYFNFELSCCWLQLEIFLIEYMIKNKLQKSDISNRNIAISLGWLDNSVTKQDTINRACRKVTDNLRLLKDKRKTIKINHHHHLNKKGSHHIIIICWDIITQLYSDYSINNKVSIREKKGIKYRIISVVKKNNDNTNINNYDTLLDKQKNIFLKGYINIDIQDINDCLNALELALKNKENDIPKRYFDAAYFDIEYNYPILNIKSKITTLDRVLSNYKLYLINYFFKNYQINLNIF